VEVRLIRRALLFLPVVTLMSCATIVSGTHENIAVNSSPAGARASLRCPGGKLHEGVTPATMSIPRNVGDCSLTVSKEGFSDRVMTIERGINPAHWFNFTTIPLVMYGVLALAGGFYGEAKPSEKRVGAVCLLVAGAAWIIDHRTGAAHRHEPAKIEVTLQPRK